MVGNKYQHYNGNVYKVLILTNEESTNKDYAVTVVYQNVHNNTIWSRPLSDWYRSFTLIETNTESKKIYDIDLTKLGFVNDILETEFHIVSYVFYDIGRLMIRSKPKCGDDEVYIEDYFELNKFINIIFYVTGFKIQV